MTFRIIFGFAFLVICSTLADGFADDPPTCPGGTTLITSVFNVYNCTEDGNPYTTETYVYACMDQSCLNPGKSNRSFVNKASANFSGNQHRLAITCDDTQTEIYDAESYEYCEEGYEFTGFNSINICVDQTCYPFPPTDSSLI